MADKKLSSMCIIELGTWRVAVLGERHSSIISISCVLASSGCGVASGEAGGGVSDRGEPYGEGERMGVADGESRLGDAE